MTAPYDMIRAHLGTAVPFANTTGVILTALGDGTGEATLEQRPETSNHIGTQHAGAMFTLGEAASGAAVAGALAPVILQSRPVAKEARIGYVKIAKGTLTATAQTSRPGADLLAELQSEGKTVFDVTVDIRDSEGETVCEMTVAWHVRSNS
jgi:acyl-coenzyme A thioesterase PaaI-like protein